MAQSIGKAGKTQEFQRAKGNNEEGTDATPNERSGTSSYSFFFCGVSRSTGLTPSASANSHSETTVGLRFPCSRPLMYCWLKPDFSANASCVRPFSSLSLLTFRPTSFRMSMRHGLADVRAAVYQL